MASGTTLFIHAGVSIQTPFLKIIYFKLAYKVVDYHKAFSYVLSFG